MLYIRIKSEGICVTPDDDRIAYDLDWRLKFAVLPLGDKYLDSWALVDKEITEYRTFLMYRTSRCDTHRHYFPAARWIEGPRHAQQLLEALLLCELSYDDIGKLLGVDGRSVEIFEKMFFNVRTGADGQLPRLILLSRFSTLQDPVERSVKKSALIGGFEFVKNHFGLHTTTARSPLARLAEMAVAEATRRLVAGEFSSSDLAKLTAVAATLVPTPNHESELEAQNRAMRKTLTEFLHAMAPQVIQQTKSDEQLAREDALLKERFLGAAEQHVVSSPLTKDVADRGLQAVDDLLRANATVR